MSRWWADLPGWAQQAVLVAVALALGLVLAPIAGRPVTEFWKFTFPAVLIMAVAATVGRSVLRRRNRDQP